MHRFSVFTIVGSLLLTTAAAHAVQVTSTWTGIASGNWNVAANWLPTTVPNNGGGFTYAVIIDDSRSDAVVTLNIDPTIDSLAVDGGDQLLFPNDRDLAVVVGPITNDGVISLNSTGNGTDLRIGASLSMLGSGTLLLSNHTNNFIRNNFGGVPQVLNGPSHTIRGAGQIGVNSITLFNQGLIDANQSTSLQFDLHEVATSLNTGTLQASGGGTMNLLNSPLDNTDGLIQALNGSVVNVIGSTVTGGELHTEGSGVISPSTNVPLFQNITLTGLLQHSNDEDAAYSGTITNDGTLSLESTGNGTEIRINTAVTTFAGSGEIAMSDHVNNFIRNNFGAVTQLVNGPSHTIHGAGQIGANSITLVNQGLIDADQPTALQFDLHEVATSLNSGTMQASGGGTMNLLNSPIDNTNGLIQALDGSVVNIMGSSITGGELHTEGSGVIGTSTNVPLFQDITLTGLLQLSNDEDAACNGTIVNEGIISLESVGNGTDIRINSAEVAFTGTGAIVMSDHINNFIRNNFGAVTQLVNDVDHTIRGAGQIGVNSITLVNEGLIDADQPTVLQFDLHEVAASLNTGTMQASDGGTMNLLNSPIDNTDGQIQALDGSVVNVIGSSITGGELHTEGSGVIGTSTNVPLFQDITLTGLLQLSNDEDAACNGTITNNGTISLESTANGTDIRVNSAVATFDGSGEIVMSNHVNNFIRNNFGSVTQMVNGADHTVRGSGQLGVNSINLLNQGSIIAETSAGLSIDCNGLFENQGLLHVTSNGGATIQPGPFTTSGAVTIDATRTLTRQGNYDQTAGVTTVNGTLSMQSGGVVNLTGGALKGSGTVSGTVNNDAGSVQPGTSAGILTIQGNYTQEQDASMLVELNGFTPGTQYDRLVVSGTASLDGRLLLAMPADFDPGVGTMFTILTAGALNGQFEDVVPCSRFQVSYTATSVVVTIVKASTLGDLNCDGEVNGFDLAILLGDWGPCSSSVCPADLNNNGVVNGFDLAILLGQWT